MASNFSSWGRPGRNLIFILVILSAVSWVLPSGTKMVADEERISFFSKLDNESNEYIKRSGILHRRPAARATVLLLHGYGNDKFDLGPFRLLFKNYNTFTFDFRAHGEHTPDQLSTLGCDEVYDVYGAVDYLRQLPGIKDLPLIVFAFSMGAATAIEAQAQYKLFDAMFLDTPFSSSVDVVKQGLDSLKFKMLGYEWDLPGRAILEKHAFNPYVQSFLKFLIKLSLHFEGAKIETLVKPIAPVESIKQVDIPCFFVICKNDEKVPVAAVRKIFANHHGFKRLWVADGRRHCDTVFNKPEVYEEIANKFIQAVISGDYKHEVPALVLED